MKKGICIIISIVAFTLHSNAQMLTNYADNNKELTIKDVEGRWIEEDEKSGEKDIYIFRKDSSFHKAKDTGELLVFNIAGHYTLSNDSIKIFYQDFSRSHNRRIKVRTMYLHVTSFSKENIDAQKTDRNKSSFTRLRRQNIE